MNQYYEQTVTAAKPLGGHRLRVTFADGFSAEIDLEALLGRGPIFEPLRDPDFFARVGVEEGFGCLIWPGDLDLSSGSLRAWCEAGKFMDYDETNAWIKQHAVAAEKVA
jgi:hypothetical protein